jgi:hypothetical protein
VRWIVRGRYGSPFSLRPKQTANRGKRQKPQMHLILSLQQNAPSWSAAHLPGSMKISPDCVSVTTAGLSVSIQADGNLDLSAGGGSAARVINGAVVPTWAHRISGVPGPKSTDHSLAGSPLRL